MVNQHLKLEGSYASGATEEVVDTFSPASGETVETVALYFDADSNTEYSLFLEEQTIYDRIPGDDVPTRSEPLALDLRLEQGDTIKLAATDLNSTGTEARAVILQTNTNIRGQ
jgi:hypothetical protein